MRTSLKDLLEKIPRYRGNSNKWPGLRVKIGWREYRLVMSYDGQFAEVCGRKGTDARRVFAKLELATGRAELCDMGRCCQPLSERDLSVFRAVWHDPVAWCDEHGRTHHFCCFCGEALTRSASTERGYGPVCAQRYGLPWGNRGYGMSMAQVSQALFD